MIDVATGPLWSTASQVFSQRNQFQAELDRQDNLRKTPERERSRVADYLRQNKDLNRAQVRYPFDNLNATVNIQMPPSVVNIYV
ncbi:MULTISPECIES: hypothetical protein [Gammaproteobacteria]|uniref:hypothetical protein n=1 Tax=Gammaproteobacteria TaxID=1236 RepID=UPI000DCFEE9B|nr:MULTISPECIES: hypothetical protein [Gammaproteobacteria]RTE87573.1 hypothetical protein DQX04_04140 [Aliidiomarina sp. B3213]TCZ92643.1 hypothetical protein EYQ95_01165 [Lysobacter sp. N42]